jgi:hypothetical protein
VRTAASIVYFHRKGAFDPGEARTDVRRERPSPARGR